MKTTNRIYRKRMVFAISAITLFSTIGYGVLSAQSDTASFYTEAGGKLDTAVTLKELRQIRVQKQDETITTCTYPQDVMLPLCDGFSVQEDGIYTTNALQPGSMIDHQYVPYIYEINYVDTQGIEQIESLEIKRAEKTAVTAFPDQVITQDHQPIQIEGNFDQVSFTSDDPDHVSFDGAKIQIEQGAKETITVTATDNGSSRYSGGSVQASFTNQKTISKIETMDEEEIKMRVDPESQIALLSITPTDADVWYSGENTLQVKVELVNKDQQFTVDMNGHSIPNYSVKLQAQFVNLLNNPNVPADLEKTDILNGSLSEQQVQALFSGSNWISGSAIDTTLAYANPIDTSEGTTHTWIQTLQVTYPKEEGVYLIRYRLFDTAAGQIVPLRINNGVYDTENGFFDFRKIIGQDFTAPEVGVLAKRAGEDDYHELQTGELLGNGASIKVDINADIAGVRTQEYQFVNNGNTLDQKNWKNIPADGILAIPDDFGGTLEVRVSDNLDLGEGAYRTTSVSKQILPPADYIVLTLPQADDRWQNIITATTWMISPTDKVIPYDGVLFSLTNSNKQVKEVYVEKEKFVKNRYDLPLEDGRWSISARVVTRDNSDPDNPVYTTVDEKSKADTRLAIDHSAEITAIKGDKKEQTYSIIVKGTTGPSGIQSVKRNVTVLDKTYTSYINVDGMGQYNDIAQLNGSYSYTITNNAGKTTTSNPVIIDGLNNTSPVLDVKATDSMGNEVQSGDTAEHYIEIWAEDINPNSTNSDIQICINGSCKDYTMGDHIRIEDDAHIAFKTKDNTKVLDEFDITITGNYDLGSVTITNQNSFGDDVWLSDDANVNVQLTGGDEEVYLEANVGGAGYQKLSGTSASISIQKEEETSSQTLVLVRSSDGEHVSQPQRVMVNIDKVSPTLVIKQEHNQLNSQSIASFTIRVGGSGLASASVKDETGIKDLSNYMEQNTLKDYPMEMNGTYTFTITAGNGRSTTKEVTVTGLNENKIHVTPLVGDIDKAVSYTGTWTKENVTFTLSGGLQDMAEFKSYQKKTSKGTWEDCGDTITFTEDQEDTIQFRVLLKDDTTSSETIPYSVKIDNTPPSDPVITLHKVNDHQVANFLRAITFNTFLKEGRVAEITSNDTGSAVTIYYQFADASGKYDTNLSSSKWVKYEDALTLDKEGKVAIVAYAVDEAGNPSNITDGDGMVFDFTAPVLMGVDGESGYIPRTIAYQDSLSGLADTQIFKFNDVDQSLAQGTKLKEPGTYHFEISDRAGNVTIKDFTLKPMPNPDDIDGSDESKDIIDEIQDEFDKNKEDLDEDTKKDIQDKIDEIEDAFNKQRVDHLEDKETGAALDGNEDTTFPKDAVLTVRRISEEVSEEDRAGYESLANRLSEKADITDLYEVKITLDGKELEIHGSATLSIQRVEETERFAYIEETAMKELSLTKTETGFSSIITHTGRYATLIKDQNQGGDSDQVDQIIDEESGAVITGIDGTTFHKYAVLTVRRITSDLNEEEKSTYQMQALEIEKELQDVYEVTLTYDGKEVALEGSAELSIPMDSTPDGIARIQEDRMQEQSFTQEEEGIRFQIDAVGRYAMLNEVRNDDPNWGDDGTNGGGQGNGHSTLGNYFGGGVDTGDTTTYGILFVLMMMSLMVISHIRSIENEKGDE